LDFSDTDKDTHNDTSITIRKGGIFTAPKTGNYSIGYKNGDVRIEYLEEGDPLPTQDCINIYLLPTLEQ
jgi:hypothetical protein